MISRFAVVACLVAGMLAWSDGDPAAPSAAPDPPPGPPTALVTGANRGLGLEFARQLSAAGYRVIGTARRPEAADELRALGVRVERLDVTDPASVQGLAEAIEGLPVDLLINNAGVLHRNQSLEGTDLDEAERMLQVNCLGPMRVTRALLPALQRGDRKLVVNISSRLGCIEGNTSGGHYGYRESKAALNMFTRSIAAELGPQGFTCIAVSPGWVRTDMGGPNARLSPEQSVRGMVEVIERLTPEMTGRFLTWEGREMPW